MYSPSTLQTALAAQARLRAIIGVPMTMVWLWLHYATDKVAPWADFSIAVYCIYVAITWVGAKSLPERYWNAAIYCTAVADAVVLMFWIPLIEDAAGVILGFALFTSLGYGLRTGKKRVMTVNQLVTLGGYAVIIAIYPEWLQHPIRTLSFAVPLIIIPLYVGTLLDKLHAARQRAEEETRAKSDLLAKVSHELRTPLGGIVSAADLIHMMAPAAPQGGLASTILALAKHLQDDIADLLDQAKYEAKALTLSPGVCDIRQVMSTVQAAVSPKAREKHLDLQVIIDPRLNSAALTDAHYLGRALLNLVGNAVKFTEEGQIVVRVIVLESTPTDFQLRFSVEDSGIGIATADQERIFTPFVQLDSGPARAVAGTGLGLSICKDVVELMGGELRVSSEIGRGSRFWFDVGFLRAAETAKLPMTSRHSDSVNPRRILVVDDNVTNLHLLREILLQDGHTVDVAESGRVALDLLASAGPGPDVIFLDYNLGDMDGIQVLQVYQFGVKRPAPVFFLTADMSADTTARLSATAACGVIGKPVRLADIREALEKAFGGQKSGPGEQAGQKVLSVLQEVPTLYLDAESLGEVAAISTRPEFLDEMLDRAVRDIESSSEALLGALGDGQWDAVRKWAHALKGVAHQMGAFRLKNLTISIMETGNLDMEATRNKLGPELANVSTNTLAALRAARSRPSPDASGRRVA